MKRDGQQGLTPIKRLLGLAGFLVVIFGSLWLGIHFSLPHRSPAGAPPPGSPLVVLLMMLFGLVFCVLGAAFYGLCLLTGGLTFGYDKPVLGGLKVRFWFINFFVGFLFQGGIALIVGSGLLAAVGAYLPPGVAFAVCFFGPFILAQFLFVWLSLWGPIERVIIRRRLAAQGISADDVRSGVFIGLSDPNRSSFKKFSLIEDDVGVLWFGAERLVYRGDSMWWETERGYLEPIVRRADAGSVSSYFGASHVLVHFCDTTGRPHYWRLHPEGGGWTMTSRARALDRLAEALESWRQGLQPSMPDSPTGFEVKTPTAPDGRCTK